MNTERYAAMQAAAMARDEEAAAAEQARLEERLVAHTIEKLRSIPATPQGSYRTSWSNSWSSSVVPAAAQGRLSHQAPASLQAMHQGHLDHLHEVKRIGKPSLTPSLSWKRWQVKRQSFT